MDPEVLTREPVIVADGPELGAPPVIPPDTEGAGQVYVVPAGTVPLAPSTGVVVNDAPLQIFSIMAVIAGFGFTVTVTVNEGPVQPAAIGVTV
jgi:hypothetical protein